MIRLLLDENLSEAILRTISSIYPGSTHCDSLSAQAPVTRKSGPSPAIMDSCSSP